MALPLRRVMLGSLATSCCRRNFSSIACKSEHTDSHLSTSCYPSERLTQVYGTSYRPQCPIHSLQELTHRGDTQTVTFPPAATLLKDLHRCMVPAIDHNVPSIAYKSWHTEGTHRQSPFHGLLATFLKDLHRCIVPDHNFSSIAYKSGRTDSHLSTRCYLSQRLTQVYSTRPQFPIHSLQEWTQRWSPFHRLLPFWKTYTGTFLKDLHRCMVPDHNFSSRAYKSGRTEQTHSQSPFHRLLHFWKTCTGAWCQTATFLQAFWKACIGVKVLDCDFLTHFLKDLTQVWIFFMLGCFY